MEGLLYGMEHHGISLRQKFLVGTTIHGNSMISQVMGLTYTLLQTEGPAHGETQVRELLIYLSVLPLVVVQKCHLDR